MNDGGSTHGSDSEISDDGSIPDLVERVVSDDDEYDSSDDENNDALNKFSTLDYLPFGIDSSPNFESFQGFYNQTVSGPIVLSDGAFELFKTEAVRDGGVDNVVNSTSNVPPLVPTMLSHATRINGVKSNRAMRTLIDHGASHSILHKQVLLRETKPQLIRA